MKKHFVVILTMVLLSAFVLVGCEKKQTAPPPSAQPVVAPTRAPEPVSAPKPAPVKPAKK